MYNITKRKAPEIRSQFLQELAEARAAKNNTKAASEIKSMRVQEEIRASFRRKNYMRRKKSATGVSLISFTDSEGKLREAQQREVVEIEIMKNNQRKITKTTRHPRMGRRSSVIWEKWATGRRFRTF